MAYKKNLSPNLSWTLISVFVAFSLLLAVSGYYLNIIQRNEIKKNIHAELSSILKLKKDQIHHWLEERLRDGENIYGNPSFINDLQSYLDNKSNLAAKKRIIDLMANIAKDNNYSGISLFDSKLHLIIYSKDNPILDKEDPARLKNTIESKKIYLSDLHKSEITQNIHFDLMIPLINTAESKNEITGIMLFRIRPENLLYPLIETWPINSRTGETVIFRRENDSIMYLNNLKFKSNTALNYKRSMNNPLLPSANALRGKKGLFEGLDYRGVPVLSDIDKIQGTNWSIVTKEDLEEIYSPLREKTFWLALLVIILVLMAGISTYLIWKNQQAKIVKQQYDAELERRALQNNFDYLLKYANDIILHVDLNGNIIEANDKAVLTYGYSRNELLKLNIRNIRTQITKDFITTEPKSVELTGGEIFETEHIKKNGQSIPVEVSSSMVEIESGKYLQSIIRDLSEKKETIKKINRLNQMYLFLSQVNQSILRMHSHEDLYREICRVAVEYGKVDTAWIGEIDLKEKTIVPEYFLGAERSLFDGIDLSLVKRKPFHAVYIKALLENKIIICADITTNEVFSKSMNKEIAAGYRSAVSIPISFNNEIVCVLNFLSRTRNHFGIDQFNLFEEIGMDISFALEVIQKDEELRRSEEKFRLLFNKMLDGFALHEFILDANGKPYDYKFLEINEAFEKMTGFEREKTIGKTVRQLLPNIENYWIENYAKVAFEGMPIRFENFSSDLNKYYDVLAYSPEKGKFAVITKDVSGDKTRDKQIRKLSGAVEQSPTCIIITNTMGNIEYVNPSFEKITGYSYSEAIGNNPSMLKSGEITAETYKELWDTIKAGKVWRGELYNKKKNGELYWESATISPVRDESGNITNFIGIKEDITKNKLAQIELIEAKEKAEKLDRIKTVFLAQMSHEIRTPIHIILSFISLIKGDLKPKLSSDIYIAFDSIDAAGKRIIRTIDLLLNMSELQTGSYETTISEIDLKETVIESLYLQFKLQAKNKNLELNFYSEDIDAIITGDLYSVTQIFANLIDNAIKYTNQGKVEIFLNRNNDNNVTVEVKDSGIGISEEYLPELFSPFTQEEQGYTRGYEGNGLGLALVKKYCDINKANITVESMKGKGTTFKVIFPISNKV